MSNLLIAYHDILQVLEQMPDIYQGISVRGIAQFTESRQKFVSFFLLPFVCDESSVTQILKYATSDDERETKVKRNRIFGSH